MHVLMCVMRDTFGVMLTRRVNSALRLVSNWLTGRISGALRFVSHLFTSLINIAGRNVRNTSVTINRATLVNVTWLSFNSISLILSAL
jgi:hypothetical protein